ncbi:MAG: hypothetical protein P1V20_00140 [Verrucomicrobiales bacterium]|nr:hypothetical protein [Verrucomicrobiales bacterium]
MQPIPITILAGSDHRPGPLPKDGPELHSLGVYKGAEVTVKERPLIDLLIEQIEKSGSFSPITIAGPSEVYTPLNLNATIVDTNGSVATNLRAAMENHQERFGDQPIALLAYDVLVQAHELDELRQKYEQQSPCAIWVPFVEMPTKKEELGAFGWKPTYGMYPEKGAEKIQVLPGHLAIMQPSQMRLRLLYRLLDLAYKTRNHSVATRRKVMLRSVLGNLISEDFRALMKFHAPNLMVSVISNGLLIANQLRRGELTIPELEKAIGSIFLKPGAHSKRPGEGVRHPVVDILSLAEDVDTEEEAAGLEEEIGD